MKDNPMLMAMLKHQSIVFGKITITRLNFGSSIHISSTYVTLQNVFKEDKEEESNHQLFTGLPHLLPTMKEYGVVGLGLD